MTDNKDLLSQLQEMLHWKKSRAFYAAKLNISESQVEELLEELKSKKESEIEESSKKINNDKGTLESSLEVSFEPKSDEELYKLHKIDKTKYKISSYWSKLKSNGKFTSSVFATLRKPADYTLEDFTKFLTKWEPTKFAKEVRHYPANLANELDPIDVELNIADFHLAKKTFEKDTLKSKELDYYKVVTDLVTKIKANYNIRKLVFPISNDFFHTDNYQNTTTNGTPQDVTAWYDEEYEKGFDILANTIHYLCKNCQELEIILVQGNHDRTKGFFVAHALEKYFQSFPEYKLTFQREHSTTKSVLLGNTFIGYHHGNSVKLENLPLVFATGKDASKFGNAKYREIHTGDKHHYLAKEVQGVRIQQMPSLSKTDRWHRDNNFENKIHAALALVYHPIDGKIAEFETRL